MNFNSNAWAGRMSGPLQRHVTCCGGEPKLIIFLAFFGTIGFFAFLDTNQYSLGPFD
jgi:hypothetical protein